MNTAYSLRWAATAALAMSLTAGAAPAETLKFAHVVPPAHTITVAVVDPLLQQTTEATGGSLVIDVYPGGELGPGPVEQYVRAVNGVADIVWGLAGYTSSQFPLSMIVELPGVVDAAGSGYGAMWAAYDDYLTGEFPGTRPLALWTSEPNVLIMKDKEIRTPADIAGLKIRVSGAVPGQVIEALGATPVQMPATEMYNALQTGLIDGIMTGASAIRDFRVNEVADVYVTGPSLGNILFYVVMNEAKYQSLPDAEKAAIDAASGAALSQSGEDNWNRVAAEVLDELRADPSKTVIDLNEEESAAFNEITVGVRDEVIAELDAEGQPASDVLAVMTGGAM
jgi:TRAP-type C4-dicarboxylate transport system substrate-binding protein